MSETDILILGATGFTGRLITQYLSTHPQRTHFTLGIGGRSAAKLEQLAKDLGLNIDPSAEDGVGVFQVDLKDQVELERVVKSAKIIINAIGPYFLSGTPIVRLCARNGVHYLDLSGETHWHQQLIREYDYIAARSGAIIVPSCAFNAVLADICVYLATKSLRGVSMNLLPGRSTTVYERKGGISGGTVNTTISTFDNVDPELLQRSMVPFALSPIVGKHQPARFAFVSKLSIPKKFGGETYYGCYSAMASINTAIVHRTSGLLEAYRLEHGEDEIHYGHELEYSEFLRARNSLTAFFSSLSLALAFVVLLFKPTRFLFSKVVLKPGDGPSELDLQKGHFVITNITASAPSPSSDTSSNIVKIDTVYAKTTIRGQIDPGYFSSAVMVSEAALAILLPLSSVALSTKPKHGNIANLTPLARNGGLLTPMSAFGEVLIKRMEETGKFKIASEVLRS